MKDSSPINLLSLPRVLTRHKHSTYSPTFTFHKLTQQSKIRAISRITAEDMHRYTPFSAGKEPGMKVEHTTYDKAHYGGRNINKAMEEPQPESPKLRRKDGIENFKREEKRQKQKQQQQQPSARVREDAITERTPKMTSMGQIKFYRDEIKAGRWEKVVPPSQGNGSGGGGGNRPHHAPPPTIPFFDRPGPSSQKLPTPRVPPRAARHRSDRSRRTKSLSEKMGDMMVDSMDVVDEATRGIISKCSPLLKSDPFKRLSGRKASIEWDFTCEGDEVADTKTRKAPPGAVPAPPRPARRASGDGTSPWAQTYIGRCRLCSADGVAGIRGICIRCEREYLRPKSPRIERPRVERPRTNSPRTQSSQKQIPRKASLTEEKPEPWEQAYLEEMGPFPPREEKKDPRSRYRPDAEAFKSKPLPPLPKDGIKLGNAPAASRPVVQDSVVSTESLAATVEDDERRYTRWQQEMLRPLNPRRGPPSQEATRDTEFYGFYDEVLGGYGKTQEKRR